MPRPAILVRLLLTLVVPASLFAQTQTNQEQFRSLYGHDCCRNYSEFTYMCESIMRGRASPNPPVCNGGGSGSGTTTARSVSRGAFATALIVGAPVGALGGSLVQNPDGQSFWAGGAALGFAVVGGIRLAVTAGEMSAPAVLVVAPLIGAAGGAGYGMYQKAQIDPTAPVVPGAKNRMTRSRKMH